MATETKSLAQIYYEEVEALKADGMSNADAIREVAKKHGKKDNAVRGGIHQYRSRQGDSDANTTTRRRTRTSAPSVDGLLADARRSLEEALALVDREVDEAKQALDAAQDRYDAVQAAVADRKKDIERKVQALS